MTDHANECPFCLAVLRQDVLRMVLTASAPPTPQDLILRIAPRTSGRYSAEDVRCVVFDLIDDGLVRFTASMELIPSLANPEEGA